MTFGAGETVSWEQVSKLNNKIKELEQLVHDRDKTIEAVRKTYLDQLDYVASLERKSAEYENALAGLSNQIIAKDDAIKGYQEQLLPPEQRIYRGTKSYEHILGLVYKVHYFEQQDDYQGEWLAIVKKPLPDDTWEMGIVRDWFGSCSGCDQLEALIDEEPKEWDLIQIAKKWEYTSFEDAPAKLKWDSNSSWCLGALKRGCEKIGRECPIKESADEAG